MSESGPRTKNSFGRINRLRGRSNFLDVQRGANSTRLKGKSCRIWFADSNDSRTSFGISVRKKVGSAVTRNRKKRIIREFLRNHKSLWPNGKRIVIGLDTPVENEIDLVSEIERLLKTIE